MPLKTIITGIQILPNVNFKFFVSREASLLAIDTRYATCKKASFLPEVKKGRKKGTRPRRKEQGRRRDAQVRGCNLLLKTSSFRVEPSLLMGDFTPSISSSSIALPGGVSDFRPIPSRAGTQHPVQTHTEPTVSMNASKEYSCHSLQHSRARGGHCLVAEVGETGLPVPSFF